MLRYICLIRLEESEDARDAYRCVHDASAAMHPEFSLAYETSAVSVVYADTTPGRIHTYPLRRDGVVIGTLFRSAGAASSPILSLSETEIDEIRASRGDALVRRYWGHYIALIKISTEEWRVIRDPTGGFPCSYVQSNRIALLFSHLDDCIYLLPTKLTVNYAHLYAFLQLHRFVPRDTGFTEVSAIQAGEALDFHGSMVTRTCLWHPASFCRHPADHEDIGVGIEFMREVVVKCVHSWAACRRSILHELSGGLDSSIVLACLAAAPTMPRLACCVHVTDSPEGDERFYARLMASHCRVQLTEQALRPKVWSRIEDLVRIRDPLSPLFASFQCSEDADVRELVEAGSFDCTFSGQGGDHLFLRTLPSITAADYGWVHGLSSRLWTVIVDTSHVSRQPLWNIARQAIRYGYLRRPYDIWGGLRVPSFIRAPAIDLSHSCHPWLDGGKQLPPAKLLQVMCLTETQTYFATPRAYVDEIHPLISQPLLECCLQIPTYILSHGGTDRSIARAAFCDALPPEISQRSSKGAVNQYFFHAVYGNRERIRPFLLDGLLAERGLLDRPELEKALDDPATIARGQCLIPIMTAATCEMWLRNATSLVQSSGSPCARQAGDTQRIPRIVIYSSPLPECTQDRGGTSLRASDASARIGPPSPDLDPPGLRAKT